MSGIGGFFQYEFQKNWSVVYQNVVGTTKDTSFRGILQLLRPQSQQGAKNDALTIYIDPINGNDANSGFTLALAKLTWDSAVAAHIATPARTTIHIDTTHATIRDFTLTASLGGIAVNYPETLDNVQSAAGTITTITADGYYQATGVIIKFHSFQGVCLKNVDPINEPAFVFGGVGTGKGFYFKWCQLVAQSWGSDYRFTVLNCHCQTNLAWQAGLTAYFQIFTLLAGAQITAYESIMEMIN